MKNKRLSSFQEYLKEKKQMNENVNIECEFWDEYIDNIYILHIKDLIWTHYHKNQSGRL